MGSSKAIFLHAVFLEFLCVLYYISSNNVLIELLFLFKETINSGLFRLLRCDEYNCDKKGIKVPTYILVFLRGNAKTES